MSNQLLAAYCHVASAWSSLRDQRGAVMSEYGILIFFVGIAAFGILVLFGGEVWELYGAAESEFDSSRGSVPPAD